MKQGVLLVGRTIEVNTHKPGSLGALIGKRVYQYSTRATTTPSSTNDYTYTYDAVGNVQVVSAMAGGIGYGNFKGRISGIDPDRERLYMRVWDIMRKGSEVLK